MSCVCYAFASVHCWTLWSPAEKRADLLALVGDVYFIFVTFLCGILGHMWYLIVSFRDRCHLTYFVYVMLSRLFIAALWSPGGKGLTF